MVNRGSIRFLEESREMTCSCTRRDNRAESKTHQASAEAKADHLHGSTERACPDAGARRQRARGPRRELPARRQHRRQPRRGAQFDWESFFNAAGEERRAPDASRADFTASGFDRDFVTNTNGSFNTSDSTTFATGSKDTLNITPGWQCTSTTTSTARPTSSNAYAAEYDDAVTARRSCTSGSSATPTPAMATSASGSFRTSVECVSPGGATAFTGDHTDGDLLVVSEFSNGGAVATIQAYRWDGGANGTLNPEPRRLGRELPYGRPGDDSVCAVSTRARSRPRG